MGTQCNVILLGCLHYSSNKELCTGSEFTSHYYFRVKQMEEKQDWTVIESLVKSARVELILNNPNVRELLTELIGRRVMQLASGELDVMAYIKQYDPDRVHRAEYNQERLSGIDMSDVPVHVVASLDLAKKGMSYRDITDHIDKVYSIRVAHTTPKRWVDKYENIMMDKPQEEQSAEEKDRKIDEMLEKVENPKKDIREKEKTPMTKPTLKKPKIYRKGEIPNTPVNVYQLSAILGLTPSGVKDWLKANDVKHDGLEERTGGGRKKHLYSTELVKNIMAMREKDRKPEPKPEQVGTHILKERAMREYSLAKEKKVAVSCGKVAKDIGTTFKECYKLTQELVKEGKVKMLMDGNYEMFVAK